MKSFFILVLLVFSINCTYSQTKQKPTVELDLGSRSFVGDTGLPFDVPFTASGKAKDISMITVRYRVKNFKKWMEFPNKNGEENKPGEYSNPIDWTATSTNEDNFYLPIGPLHPNVEYEFEFKIYKKPDLTEAQKTELRNKVLALMEDYLKNVESINNAGDEKLEQDIEDVLKNFLPERAIYTDQNGNPLKIYPTDGVLGYVTTKIIQTNNTIKARRKNIENRVKKIIEDQKATGLPSIIEIVQKIIDGSTSLETDTKKAWEGILDSSNPSFKTTVMLDMAKVFANQNLLINILSAKKSITDVDVNDASIDLNTLSLISTFVSKVCDSKFIDNNSKPVVDRSKYKIDEILKNIENLKKDISVLAANLKEFNTISDKFPDVLAHKFVSETVELTAESTSDVVSQNNPYIGLDFGFAFVPPIDQLFMYEGVNFYFSPVNKDAPLSSFTTLRGFFAKRLSIHMGLTQSLITANNDRYVPLIKDVGSILLGAGLRINRIVRINGGLLFFYLKSPSPVVADQKLDLTYKGTISITIDINVAKALGSVGKRLGLDK